MVKARERGVGKSGVPRSGRISEQRVSPGGQLWPSTEVCGECEGERTPGLSHLSVKEDHLQITDPRDSAVRVEQMGKQLGLSCLVLCSSGNPKYKGKWEFPERKGEEIFPERGEVSLLGHL